MESQFRTRRDKPHLYFNRYFNCWLCKIHFADNWSCSGTGTDPKLAYLNFDSRYKNVCGVTT